MVQGMLGFIEYLNVVIDSETDSLINVNKKLRRALSKRTIMTIDQKLHSMNATDEVKEAAKECRIKTPTRVGRFELASNIKSSKYANNKYFASYSFGKRNADELKRVQPLSNDDIKQPNLSATTPRPWYDLAQAHIQMSEAVTKSKMDSINTINLDASDILKKQVTIIGEHAICVLRGTCSIFKESFEEQFKEYSELHDACSNKIPEWKKNIAASSFHPGLSEDIKDNPLVLKSSSSERNIHERKERYFDKSNNRSESRYCALRSTQSLSSIESSHRCLPSLLVHKNLDNINRPEMKIPKAIIPRKGTIMLHTDQIHDVKTNDKGYDEKKRFKPVPISHKKLMNKQKEILGKVFRPANIPEQDLVNFPRTVLELSHQIVEFERKHTRDLPPLPRRQTVEMGQQTLTKDSTTKDKLLMHS
ncbi:uncharacterized protein LOC117117664 [Anneissia japonica]|uniref:uncharacterized protein LOC117117664 n=1 Tax=Anneissia japonica TaxID=1529436 RepID=UPI001425B435|nr:uncharacterized protein LOC117117664 [Anneissia japonica]